jgi:uncharacterized membrane protein YfcA
MASDTPQQQWQQKANRWWRSMAIFATGMLMGVLLGISGHLRDIAAAIEKCGAK